MGFVVGDLMIESVFAVCDADQEQSKAALSGGAMVVKSCTEFEGLDHVRQ